MTAGITVGLFTAAGVFLVLRPGLVRITIGFVLLGHAANIMLLVSGGLGRRDAPLIGRSDQEEMADPLPQAFILTALVITFGITVFLLGLARAGHRAGDSAEQPGEQSGGESADGEEGPRR